jgi:multidrug efflux pump
MNFSTFFITRPVATTLLALGVLFAGALGYLNLPVSPLPQVDFPTILVQASLPGTSPDVMASSVAEPLERRLSNIADVDEMTSQSFEGSTRIVLQFGLDRNIDGAARDVEAALNAAHADLPTQMRGNPTYNKVNPADAPFMVLALTSATRTRGQIDDVAANVVQQSLAQVDGVGQVNIVGSALPAVRVEINPNALSAYGIGFEDVRAALGSANADSPKGAINVGDHRYQLYTNDQALKAADYKPLIIAYRNNAGVRLTDVADVIDSVQDVRNSALSNGKPSVLALVYRQPGANIIDTVERVRAKLGFIRASIPADIDISVVADRTPSIRASLNDTELTLVISIVLVILVVFLFLRNLRATLVPSIALPISILGTFGGMYLCGYSIDILSLMALTVATGFVVDDAIVVLENISRHIEGGMPRMQAAILGAREVGFTVLSMSLSLIAVFLPILLMGGLVGRLFREFAATLSLAITISLAVSLTIAPMLCARILRVKPAAAPSRIALAGERAFEAVLQLYARSLAWSLRHSRILMMIFIATIGLNIYLIRVIPKGFFPDEDIGRMVGGVQADQSISFQAMQQKMQAFSDIVLRDPAVENIVGFTGGRQSNYGFFFIVLKSRDMRAPIKTVMGRLRGQLNHVAGARLFLQPIQDIRAGGRSTNALYQFTLQGNSSTETYEWTRRLTEALQHQPMLADVNTDQQQHGLEARVIYDRATAARLGLVPRTIDENLYDAFGQRQASTIYTALDQYYVIMEVAPQYWQDPSTLEQLFVSTSGALPNGTQVSNFLSRNAVGQQASAGRIPVFEGGFHFGVPSAAKTAASAVSASINLNAALNSATNSISNIGGAVGSSGAAVSTAKETMVPLNALSEISTSDTPLIVNHQGQFVASTISFNLPPGVSLGEAIKVIETTMRRIGVPDSIHGSFAGVAKMFQASLNREPILILGALITVYMVLGILYESYIHPLTILSTLPSAGVGAVLALMVFHQDFSIIALIGVFLLIGIVKKNAIMMIDFALIAEREEHLSPRDAIYCACLLRFRPIMMTTFAAMLGALPLAIGHAEGAELRYPLGISIVGGLIVSQALTLYTTPVVYLYLDRFRLWSRARWRRSFPPLPDRVAEPGE